jgi:acyl-coenzyme A synthetase/AMP-(fatty) acid ligase
MRGDMAAESRAAVIFSSGTTGKPKAIVHTQDSLRSLHEVLIETWKLSPDDRALGALPFHTIYGLFFSAASIIYAGATLVLVERFRPERVLAAIERHRVTTAAFVPTMALMILNFEDRDGYDLSSLRAVYAASAPISDSDIERFRRFSGAPMIANYGLTEIPGAAVEPADEPHQEGSVGKISPGFEVCVRDSEGRPLPVGETGEITVRGPSQMQGYLGDPAQTAERLRDGWIHTQDIGRVDAAGNIYLSGRTSDMIMRGGLNISPHEVEHALSTHPEVLDSAVVGTPDPIYGEVVTAFVVVRGPADGAAIAKALTDHCRSLLAAAKVPANIVLVDALPRNAGGKVLRKQLQERGVGPADEDEAMDGKGNA